MYEQHRHVQPTKPLRGIYCSLGRRPNIYHWSQRHSHRSISRSHRSRNPSCRELRSGRRSIPIKKRISPMHPIRRLFHPSHPKTQGHTQIPLCLLHLPDRLVLPLPRPAIHPHPLHARHHHRTYRVRLHGFPTNIPVDRQHRCAAPARAVVDGQVAGECVRPCSAAVLVVGCLRFAIGVVICFILCYAGLCVLIRLPGVMWSWCASTVVLWFGMIAEMNGIDGWAVGQACPHLWRDPTASYPWYLGWLENAPTGNIKRFIIE